MYRLPPELVIKVLGLIKLCDDAEAQAIFSSLRLVNRTMEVITTSYVFATIPVWLGLKSLQGLVRISERPRLSGCVTRIMFSPLRMINTHEKEPVLRQTMNDTFEYSTNTTSDSTLQLGHYVGSRLKYAAQQRFLEENNTHRKILGRAMRSLPNLASIHVFVVDNQIGCRELRQAFGQLSGREFEFHCARQIEVLMNALDDARVQLRDLRFLPSLDRDVLRDIREKKSQYTHLAANPNYERELADSGKVDRRGTWTTINIQKHMSERLWTLDQLEVTFRLGDSPQELEETSSALRLMLSSSPNLTKLGLARRKFNNCSGRDILLGQQLTASRFSRLRILSLCYFKLQNLSEFQEFLVDHRISLTDVHLWHVTIVPLGKGNWLKALTSLQRQRWVNLRSFKLSRCFQHEWKLNVIDYLTQKTDLNPLGDHVVQYVTSGSDSDSNDQSSSDTDSDSNSAGEEATSSSGDGSSDSD